jgi:streptogramin lyase
MKRVLTGAAGRLHARELAGCSTGPARTLLALFLAGVVSTTAACGGSDAPRAIAPERSISVGADPIAVAATKDALWVSVPKGLVRIDPTTNKIVATVHASSNRYLPESAAWIAADDATVWVPEAQFSDLQRVDANSNQLVAKIPVGALPQGVTTDGHSVWTANHHGGSVTKVDAVSNKVAASIPAGLKANGGPQGIASGLGSVWVGVSNVNSVIRIDPQTNARLATIKLPSTALACGDFALSTDVVWITSCGELPNVTAVDPATNQVIRSVDLGGYGAGAMTVGDAAWIAETPLEETTLDAVSSVESVDADSERPVERMLLPAGVMPGGMIHAFGAVWIVDSAGGRLLRFAESEFT